MNNKEQFSVLADLAEEHGFNADVVSKVRELGKSARWFCFHQNNSGGDYVGVRYILIEARDAKHANERAENETDIYFDGCLTGSDCSCCGDRWYRTYNSEGTDEPEIYGCPVEEGIKKVHDAKNADYMLLPL